jgi:hypothetical protein
MQTQAHTSSVASPATIAANSHAGKYLIFHLGVEEFGAEVLKVR